jgi:hypothetical protein
MEVQALAAAWKGIEESLEVSSLVNGEENTLYYPLLSYFLHSL